MTEMDVLDRLAEAAAHRRIPKGRDDAALLREASLVGRARIRARRQRVRWMVGASLALAAALLLALSPRPTPTAPISVAAEVTGLETLILGDHTLVSTVGSTLAIDALETHTSLRLNDGAVVFDVAPLGPERSFEVHTPDAVVRVVGTVFAVTVVNEHTRVDVFEGRVEVMRGTEREVLTQGESSGDLAIDPQLRARGELLAALRAARPAAMAPTAPTAPTDPIEPARLPSSPRGRVEERTPRSPITLADLRALCDRGAFAEALEAMENDPAPPGEEGEWAMLEGDAARALSDLPRAAAAYERAASALTPSRAALAGFLAASTHERMGEDEAALALLDTTGAAAPGSPLEERALAMRASLLARLGRASEAAESARRYLASFPGGEARARMERLTER